MATWRTQACAVLCSLRHAGRAGNGNRQVRPHVRLLQGHRSPPSGTMMQAADMESRVKQSHHAGSTQLAPSSPAAAKRPSSGKARVCCCPGVMLSACPPHHCVCGQNLYRVAEVRGGTEQVFGCSCSSFGTGYRIFALLCMRRLCRVSRENGGGRWPHSD